jgi:RNA polymerase primary sigma factor
MYGDLIEDVSSETPDESTLTRLRAKELANALLHLKPRMRRVLALRFGLDGETPQTLEEVGVGLGIHARARAPTRFPRLTRVAHRSTRLELYLRAE